MDSIEAHFAAPGRTPKGRKARRSIFRATRDLIVERGLDATSLEAVAEGAGLSQAALRHYFPTREELLTEFFVAATDWFKAQVAGLLTRSDASPREQLEQCLAWHLEYMEHVDTAFWLEASAYWIRHTPRRRTRDGFYRWLVSQYARLIGAMQPALSGRARQRKAYALLTLVLGAWVTHGRGSNVGGVAGTLDQRRFLVATAMALVSA